MNIRKFRLINNDGEWYDLTTREHFLHSPSGLGYAKEEVFRQLGNLHVLLDDQFMQGEILGDVFFPHPKAYDKYFQFVRFCQNTPIYLEYTPTDKSYIREVRVSTVEKTELTTGGLNCPVTLHCLSLFYRREFINVEQGSTTGGKIYNYRYNYRYSASSPNSVTIESDSFAESPCAIYIYGEAVNPVWRHYVNNILVATGKVNGTIPSDQKLMIDTTQIPYSIKRLDMANRLVADMYALSDFSTDRFITLKNGRNVISVTHDGVNILRVLMEAHITYASV